MNPLRISFQNLTYQQYILECIIITKQNTTDQKVNALHHHNTRESRNVEGHNLNLYEQNPISLLILQEKFKNNPSYLILQEKLYNNNYYTFKIELKECLVNVFLYSVDDVWKATQYVTRS